jgi:hypothetical protein
MSGRGRGRRPAANKINEPSTTAETNTNTTAIVDVASEKPTKKQSKKKQFPIVAVVTPDGIEGSLMPESRRPLIVHLPIQSKDVSLNDMPIMYDPHPPVDAVPYAMMNSDNPFYEDVEHLPDVSNTTVDDAFQKSKLIQNVVSSQGQSTSTSLNQESEIDYYSLKGTLLVEFKDSSEIKKIPDRVDAACFWCCHTFVNRPVVLPIRDTGEHLQVMGNFCSPECALSYLFDMRQDSHTRWEQLALLNRVYSEACGGKIYPAPARSTLKLFGGTLNIQEYRDIIRSHKVRVDIHLPPMVSILSTMDTKPIDFYDASLTKNVTETVKERLQKAEEVLRLRRTKPLKAWESTLDACINLKIRHDEERKSTIIMGTPLMA